MPRLPPPWDVCLDGDDYGEEVDDGQGRGGSQKLYKHTTILRVYDMYSKNRMGGGTCQQH